MRNGQTRKRLDGRRSNCCDRDGGTARNAIAHALDDLTGIKRPRQAARFVISREEKTRRGGLTEGKGLRNKIPSESCFNFFSERRVLTRGKSFSTYRSVLVFFCLFSFAGSRRRRSLLIRIFSAHLARRSKRALASREREQDFGQHRRVFYSILRVK